jgi:hypothetical protein
MAVTSPIGPPRNEKRPAASAAAALRTDNKVISIAGGIDFAADSTATPTGSDADAVTA